MSPSSPFLFFPPFPFLYPFCLQLATQSEKDSLRLTTNSSLLIPTPMGAARGDNCLRSGPHYCREGELSVDHPVDWPLLGGQIGLGVLLGFAVGYTAKKALKIGLILLGILVLL